MLPTCLRNTCNICNIPIYFCNIHMKHLQHAYETPETLETYACKMHFSTQHLLAAWAHRGTSTRSSMPARSSMPRRSPVRSSSARGPRRRKARWQHAARRRQRAQSSTMMHGCRRRGAHRQHWALRRQRVQSSVAARRGRVGYGCETRGAGGCASSRRGGDA